MRATKRSTNLRSESEFAANDGATYLVLNRKRHGENSTLGSLHLAQGLWLSWVLERGPGPNRPNIDRIPAGEYRLVERHKDENGDWEVGWAKRMSGPVVEIVGVPGRSLIIGHPANTWGQLRGCPAPGLRYTLGDDGEFSVWSSRDAFAKVNPYLLQAARTGGTITIIDEPTSERRVA